jgi:branched-chain amino acid transport system substrate-binding protein
MTTFRMTRRAMLAGTGAAAGAFAAGRLATPAIAQNAPIKIGIITDRVGNSAMWATLIGNGIELATKQVNDGGGVLGRRIELAWEDDQDRPDVSATRARKLIGEGAVMLHSLSSSTTAQQAQTASLEGRTPHMSPSHSADTLTTRLNNPYYFQLGPLASFQIRTLMAYAGSRFRKVALLTDNSALGTVNATSFREGLRAGNIEIVADETIERGVTDVTPALQRLRAANPEAIFHAGILGAEMALFFRTYHQMGLRQPVLGSFNLSIPSYLELVPGLLDGVQFIDVYDDVKPEVTDFADRYKRQFNTDPFSLPAYGYDGIMLTVDALRRAGAPDREKLREAMHATRNYTAVIGARGTTIGFAPDRRYGYPENGCVVREIRNNRHGHAVWRGLAAS